MMQFGAIIVVLAIVSAVSASAQAPDENALKLRFIAQEFYSVCVKTEANPKDVADAVKQRSWRPRPSELSKFNGESADQAWDGDLSSIKFLGAAKPPEARFVVTSSEHNRVCSFILDDTPMESLKTVLKSQGLELAGEGYRGERRQKYEYAVFCRANSSEKNISYEIDAERGPIRGWPADTAAKLTFRRFDGYPPLGPTAAYGVEGSCPIRVIIYDFFSRSPPTPPNIEPWGEKEPEAPPALEEPRH